MSGDSALVVAQGAGDGVLLGGGGGGGGGAPNGESQEPAAVAPAQALKRKQSSRRMLPTLDVEMREQPSGHAVGKGSGRGGADTQGTGQESKEDQESASQLSPNHRRTSSSAPDSIGDGVERRACEEGQEVMQGATADSPVDVPPLVILKQWKSLKSVGIVPDNVHQREADSAGAAGDHFLPHRTAGEKLRALWVQLSTQSSALQLSPMDVVVILVALALFGIICMLSYSVTRNISEDSVQEQFAGTAHLLQNLVGQEMTKHTDDVSAFAELWASSDCKEPAVVQAFGDATIDQQVGRGAMLYGTYVHVNDSTQWNAYASALTGSTATVRSWQAVPYTDPSVTERFPVLYTSTVVTGTLLLGVDFMADDVRGTAVLDSFVNEELTASERLYLFRSDTYGVFLSVPVVSNSSTKFAGADNNFTQGVIMTSIELGIILETAFATVTNTSGLQAYLIDVTNGDDEPAYLHSLRSRDLKQLLPNTSQHTTSEMRNLVRSCHNNRWCDRASIKVAERTWAVMIFATNSYRSDIDDVPRIVVGLVAGLSTVVILIIVCYLVRKKHEAALEASAIHQAHQSLVDYVCHELRNPLHCVSAALYFVMERLTGVDGLEQSSIRSASAKPHTVPDKIGHAPSESLSPRSALDFAARHSGARDSILSNATVADLIGDLRMIQANVTVMNSVVEEIMDASRFQHADVAVNLSESHSVSDLIESVVAEYRAVSSSPISVRISSKIPQHLRFDYNALRQVLVLGIHNAVKYAIQAKFIIVSARIVGPNVLVYVTDKEATDDRGSSHGSSRWSAWEPFTGRRSFGAGSGAATVHEHAREKSVAFGMPIARAIVAGHGGKVGFVSEPEKGRTTYWLTFRKFVDTHPRQEEAAPATSEAPGELRTANSRPPTTRMELPAGPDTELAPGPAKADADAQTGGGGTTTLAMSSVRPPPAPSAEEETKAGKEKKQARKVATIGASSAPIEVSRALEEAEIDASTPERRCADSRAGGISAANRPAAVGMPAISRLPLSASQLDPVPRLESLAINPENPPIDDMAELTVWMVDDEPMNRKLLKRMLMRLGVEEENILVLEDGHDLVAQVRQCAGQPPAHLVILTDIVMRRMNGDEAVREVRKHRRFANIPIVASTGDSSSENHENFLRNGFNAIMTKPFTPARIKEVCLHVVNLPAAAFTT